MDWSMAFLKRYVPGRVILLAAFPTGDHELPASRERTSRDAARPFAEVLGRLSAEHEIDFVDLTPAPPSGLLARLRSIADTQQRKRLQLRIKDTAARFVESLQ